MRNHHRPHHETSRLELPPQAKDILIIGDAQVGASLVLLDVRGADDYHYLYAVTQLLEHAQLAVRKETGQYTTGMMVIKEFASQLEIEFTVEARDSLLDMF